MSASLLPNGVARQRILVVDDNPASLYATVRILKAAGFDVLEAATGHDALDKADQSIGLIVLDINLPDIDGLEVCRRLRARGETAYLPIVHLTSTYLTSEHMDQGLSAGGDSWLTHPVDPPVLIATVRALLFARQADINRRTTDARFRTVFELASSGIVLFDQELVFTDANPEFCRMAGRPRTEIVGKRCADLVAPSEVNVCGRLYEVLAQSGRWEGTLQLQRPDGHVVSVDWRIVAESAQGARIALATNVTEREKLLESERAARAEAERSNQLKDEFLATLSHELRNPLNAMLGWASVLKRKNLTPVMLAQGIDAIERNSRIQNHLIEDLLDFAGIRFGKMRVDLEPSLPARAVTSAAEIVSSQAQSKGVAIHVDVEDSEAYVMADDSRLQQVVWNLLTNAIKFTPEGGEIRVHAGVVGGDYEIRVSDTGRGISPEFLPRIFERFSQQESGAGKSFSGLGIGLTIVKHLVDIHGGTVHVESEGLGRGATFRVRLPLTDHRPSDMSGEHPSRLKGLRVLVVEDDPDARALIVRILGEAGAKTVEATTTEAALSSIGKRAPDVLVSDIGMPQVDGYQLVRRLRNAGFDEARLPAIALTAFSRSQDRDDALSAGFQVHLAKPVRAQALVSAVAKLARK